jgi:hypothetical protein
MRLDISLVARLHCDALLVQAVLDLGHAHHVVHGLVQLFYDRPRHPSLHHDGRPQLRLAARHAGLGCGRNVRQDGNALLGQHRERRQPAASDELLG